VGNPTLQQLRLDGGTQPRAQIDLFTVNDYAVSMSNGAIFPPLVVFYDGVDYWLADGFHRAEAAKQARLEPQMDIRQGTRRDAILYSVGANATHGLRRTNEDKRRAVMTLLADDEWRRWSDSEIARRTGVSQPTVSSHRASLINLISEPSTRAYVDRYGNERLMDTSNIGSSHTPKITSNQQEEPNLWPAEALLETPETPAARPHMNVLLNEDVEWYTPPEYIEAAKDILGEIDLDPASNPTAQQIINAKLHYTKDNNGLAHEWRGKVWMNPPWGRICADFVSKLVQHYDAGDVTEAILLLNSNSNETEWFQPLWDHTLCFSRGRINYYTADGERGAGSTHGSVFVYLGPNHHGFAQRFAEFGNVVRRVTNVN
jgi:DNA-binding transcriptional ArsR family regulator